MIETSSYQKPGQLLPEEIQSALSTDAIRLYSKIWHLMNKKQRTEVWVSNNAASIMARIDVDNIEPAKKELTDTGLIEIKVGKWPADDPPNICHRYKFVATIQEQEHHEQ